MKLLRFGPKVSVSPTLGDPCSICRRPLAVGDYTTLFRHRAGDRAARAGTEVHWDCAVRLHDGAEAGRR